MKVAIISDIHDNQPRLKEALEVCRNENIKTAICCGDVASPETLEMLAGGFEKLYYAFGNADYRIASNPEQIPDNVKWFSEFGAFVLEKKHIAVFHRPDRIEKLADSDGYDILFYGHTHTPWEKKIGKTQVLNPGEVAGQYGPASFCIFDLHSMSGKLVILK